LRNTPCAHAERRAAAVHCRTGRPGSQRPGATTSRRARSPDGRISGIQRQRKREGPRGPPPQRPAQSRGKTVDLAAGVAERRRPPGRLWAAGDGETRPGPTRLGRWAGEERSEAGRHGERHGDARTASQRSGEWAGERRRNGLPRAPRPPRRHHARGALSPTKVSDEPFNRHRVHPRSGRPELRELGQPSRTTSAVSGLDEVRTRLQARAAELRAPGRSPRRLLGRPATRSHPPARIDVGAPRSARAATCPCLDGATLRSSDTVL